MRVIVLLMSLLMPLVAWFSQRGSFGPDNGVVSDRYPTLLAAAGYAFAVWGLIFALDVVYGAWQASGTRRQDATLTRIAPAAAAGFALTAAWMPLFSTGQYWLCLIVIFAALGCLAYCARVLSLDAGQMPQQPKHQRLWAWLPLSLHAGWLSVAAFLNLAQVIVAYRLLPTDAMLPWSLLLLVAAAALLLLLNRGMRGNLAYAAVALWGLVAVFVKQSQSALPGASTVAWVAVAIGIVLLGQTLWLRARRRGGPAAGHVVAG